jgi:hypothetical protein
MIGDRITLGYFASLLLAMLGGALVASIQNGVM